MLTIVEHRAQVEDAHDSLRVHVRRGPRRCRRRPFHRRQRPHAAQPAPALSHAASASSLERRRDRALSASGSELSLLSLLELSLLELSLLDLCLTIPTRPTLTQYKPRALRCVRSLSHSHESDLEMKA